MERSHEEGDGGSAGVVPTQQNPAPNAAEDVPSRPDEGSSPKSPVLSLAAATILAAGAGLVRGNDTTPADDHFVALPGGDDEGEAVARYPPFKPLKSKKLRGTVFWRKQPTLAAAAAAAAAAPAVVSGGWRNC